MSAEDFREFCRPPDEEVKEEVVEVEKDPLVLKNEELEKAFHEIDEDGNGTLEPHELKQVFQRAGFRVTDVQIELAMQCLDENEDGVIDLQEFQKLSKMITEAAVDAAKPQKTRARSKSMPDDNSMLNSMMGDFLLKGMMATVMNPDFEMNVEAAAKRKGITMAELERMLDESVPKYEAEDGPQLTPHDLKVKLRRNFEMVMTTFRKFDADNSGTIDMVEWTAAICGLFDKATQEDVENLFREFDEDGGGTIDYEEFAYTLKAAAPKKKKKKAKSAEALAKEQQEKAEAMAAAMSF